MSLSFLHCTTVWYVSHNSITIRTSLFLNKMLLKELRMLVLLGVRTYIYGRMCVCIKKFIKHIWL